MTNLTAIKRGATVVFDKTKFLAVKKSPEIFMAAGIVGIGAGTVMACKATLKIDNILDEFEDKKAAIKFYAETRAEDSDAPGPAYTEKDKKKDLTILHLQTGASLAKLYAPAVITTTTGVACVLMSHNILKKRNAALVAAYNLLDRGFKDYRGRVVEEYGEEKDRQFRHGLTKKKVEVVETDEKGKEKKVKKEIDIFDNDGGPSIYARVFDRYIDEERTIINHEWQSTPLYNKVFLKAQQNHANDKLKARGHLFLNEVYDMLGFPRTEYGALVGWVIDPTGNSGDGYVDFGIFDIGKNEYADDFRADPIGKERSAFINEETNAVLLDFNVDGLIYDKL